MGTQCPDISQHSLQYDSLYYKDSSHTGEISTQVACKENAHVSVKEVNV